MIKDKNTYLTCRFCRHLETEGLPDGIGHCEQIAKHQITWVPSGHMFRYLSFGCIHYDQKEKKAKAQ